MIVVTTGTNGVAFDRLLCELDDLADEEVVVQHGPSTERPLGARCVAYLAFDDLSRLITGARVLVTHGGAGSILAGLSAGHRPLVVPRRAANGEAVDDHQVDLAQRLHREGLVTCVDDPSLLRHLIAEPTRSSDIGAPRVPRLRDELGSYLRARAGAPA